MHWIKIGPRFINLESATDVVVDFPSAYVRFGDEAEDLTLTGQDARLLIASLDLLADHAASDLIDRETGGPIPDLFSPGSDSRPSALLPAIAELVAREGRRAELPAIEPEALDPERVFQGFRSASIESAGEDPGHLHGRLQLQVQVLQAAYRTLYGAYLYQLCGDPDDLADADADAGEEVAGG